MIDNIPPEEIPDNAVAEALNVVLDRQANLRTRFGVANYAPNRNMAQSGVELSGTSAWVPDNNEDAGDFEAGSSTRLSIGTPSAQPWDADGNASFAFKYKTESDRTLAKAIAMGTAAKGQFYFGIRKDGVDSFQQRPVFAIHDGTSFVEFLWDIEAHNSYDNDPEDSYTASELGFSWNGPERIATLYYNGQVHKKIKYPTLDLSSGLGAVVGLHIGGQVASNPFDGTLFDVRIWSELRTEPQMKASYETIEPATGSSTLYLACPIDEGVGTPAADLEGSAATVTPTGFNWVSGYDWEQTDETVWATESDIGEEDINLSGYFDDNSLTDPYGNATSATELGGLVGGVPTNLRCYPRTQCWPSIEKQDVMTFSVFASRCEDSGDAVTPASDPLTPNLDLFEDRPAAMTVVLTDKDGGTEENLEVTIVGNHNGNASAGQSWWAVGGTGDAAFGGASAPEGDLEWREVAESSTTSGGYALAANSRVTIYDASWNVILADVKTETQSGTRYLILNAAEATTLDASTPAFMRRADAPSGAVTLGVEEPRDRTNLDPWPESSDNGYDAGDYTLHSSTSSVSDDTGAAGTGAPAVAGPKTGFAIGSQVGGTQTDYDDEVDDYATNRDVGRSYVDYEFDISELDFASAPQQVNVLIEGKKGDLTFNLNEHVGIHVYGDSLANHIGSDTQTITSTTTADYTLTVAVPEGSATTKLIVRFLMGSCHIVVAPPNYVAVKAVSVEATDIHTRVLSGTINDLGPQTTDRIVAYGLREYSDDWFELYLSIDTTGYSNARMFVLPQAMTNTFDATSGRTVLDSVDDIDGTVSSFTPGDNTSRATPGLDEGANYNADVNNGQRGYWGMNMHPGLYKGDVYNLVKLSLSAYNAHDLNLFTEVTSIYEHRDGVGDKAVYMTATNDSISDGQGGTQSYHGIYRFDVAQQRWNQMNLSGLTNPAAGYNTILYPHAPTWANYDGVAYCATPGEVLIEFADINTDPVDNADSPILVNLIEWNNRLWATSWDDTNGELTSDLQCSKVGDGSDWTDTGQRAGSATWNVGGGSNGDPVTGLSVFQKKMVVFKTNRIYLMETGTPNVDLMQHNLQEWSRGTGCVAHNTIRTIRGDIVFLSRSGLASLSGAITEGNIEESLLSISLEDFEDITLASAGKAYAVVNNTESQYFIAFPVDSVAKNNKMYVLDFTSQQAQAWTEWTGGPLGNCYFELTDEHAILIGGRQDIEGYKEQYTNVFIQDQNERYHDDGYPYTSRVVTKAFTQGDEVLKKRYHRWFASLRLVGTQLGLQGHYQYDRDDSRRNFWTFDLATEVQGTARWDQAIWDAANFAARTSVNKTIRYRMHGAGGRLAQSVQFNLESQNRDQGFTLSSLGFYFTAATDRYTDRNN